MSVNNTKVMLQNSFIRRLWCLTIVMTICSTVCVLTTGAQTDRAYIRKGNRTMRAGAEGGAVDSEVSYRKALSVNSSNAQAMYNLGCALMAQQKDSAAMECFQKSVNAEKSKIRKAMAYHNMGVILQRQQQYGGAIEQYKQALRLRPNDNETRYNLVLCQRQNRNNQNNQNNQNNNSGGDNNKDNKDKNKDNKDQNKDKNKDNQDKDNQNKKEQENKNQLSKDNAERLLNAAMQEEKQTQQRLKKAMSQPKRKNLQKNW